jgi:HSP20 family protein
MLITQYNPSNEIQEFRRGFNSLNSLLETFLADTGSFNTENIIPAVNTREGKHAYHIELDLPGIEKKDISVDVKDNSVVISGERKTNDKVKKEDYYKIESQYGYFERSFSLPKNVDVENIHAESKDGVLEVVIPKLESVEDKPKKIEIK